MKCKDCRYDKCSLDGCMFSHDPNQEACKLFKRMSQEEKEHVDKRD